MAMNISGITVTLRSGAGKDIPTYKAEKVNTGIIAGFVPSEAGETFEICIDNQLFSGEGLAYDIYIDGREMQKFSCHPMQKSIVKGVYSSSGVRPFTFAKLQLKEDDGQAPSFDISQLGVIEVKVCRAIVKYDDVRPAVFTHQQFKPNLDPVSEKAKKVGWHSVSLGSVQPSSGLRNSTIAAIDQPNKPYAIFRFRYKPRELLEDEGIAPPSERPKQPVAPVTGQKRSRPEENANPGPSAKRTATQENVKPEPSASQSKTPKVEGAKKFESVKKEGAKKVKRERLDGEVIDLTNRGRSPIRVPVRGEVIDLSDD
ncbi:unnamed protein product [Peniophora sp. CBMAI 1063]|nr:unnamed protein product [Peniophora sp. CBMAI 1063]